MCLPLSQPSFAAPPSATSLVQAVVVPQEPWIQHVVCTPCVGQAISGPQVIVCSDARSLFIVGPIVGSALCAVLSMVTWDQFVRCICYQFMRFPMPLQRWCQRRDVCHDCAVATLGVFVADLPSVCVVVACIAPCVSGLPSLRLGLGP